MCTCIYEEREREKGNIIIISNNNNRLFCDDDVSINDNDDFVAPYYTVFADDVPFSSSSAPPHSFIDVPRYFSLCLSPSLSS